MRKLYSLLLVLLMAVMSTPAYSVIRPFTVYEGTDANEWVPMAFSSASNWTESEYIVPASLLSEIAGAQITGLKFYVSNYRHSFTPRASMDVMVWEVSASTTQLNGFKYPTAGQQSATFSGQVQVIYENGEAYIRIDFATPIVYNGGSIIVHAQNPSPSWNDDVHYYGQNVNGASWAGYNSEVAYVNGQQRNFAPKTTFYYNMDGKDYLALLSNDEKELTLYYVSDPQQRLGQHTGWGYVGEEWMWFFNSTGALSQYGDPFEVEKIIIDESVRTARPTDLGIWFYDFDWVTEIVGLENINTSEVTSMISTFDESNALEIIDIRSWNFSKVTSTCRMFHKTGARTILCNADLSAMSQITDSREMFAGDSRYMVLVGGNGTPWDANHIDKTYARPDKPGQPGYFSTHGQDINQISQQPGQTCNSQKLIRDGQLLIERNGKTYNAQGIEIK